MSDLIKVLMPKAYKKTVGADPEIIKAGNDGRRNHVLLLKGNDGYTVLKFSPAGDALFCGTPSADLDKQVKADYIRCIISIGEPAKDLDGKTYELEHDSMFKAESKKVA